MPGQPSLTNWITFNVTRIDVLEPGGVAPAGITPANIFPVNGHFQLQVTFEGRGFIWSWVAGTQYEAHFYVEGVGVNAHDVDWPLVTGNLVAGQNIYQVVLDIPNGIDHTGIYQAYCLVRFPNCLGMSGFTDQPAYLEVAP